MYMNQHVDIDACTWQRFECLKSQQYSESRVQCWQGSFTMMKLYEKFNSFC